MYIFCIYVRLCPYNITNCDTNQNCSMIKQSFSILVKFFFSLARVTADTSVSGKEGIVPFTIFSVYL